MSKNPDNDLSQKFGLSDTTEKNTKPETSLENEKQKLQKYIQNSAKFETMQQEQLPKFKNREYSEIIFEMTKEDPELRSNLIKNPELFTNLDLDYIKKKSDRRIYNEKLTRKYGVKGSQFLRGKFGVDMFFIFFGIFGVFAIPSYFYYKNSSLRNKFINLYKNEDFLKSLEDMDLDDISPSFSGRDMESLRKEALIKAKIQQELGNL